MNDPSKLVLDEIAQEAKNDGNPDKYFVLSLGTGEPIQTSNMKQDGGFAQVGNIMKAAWDSNQGYRDLDIEKNFPGKVKRIQTQIKIEGIFGNSTKNSLDYKALLDNTDASVLEVY